MARVDHHVEMDRRSEGSSSCTWVGWLQLLLGVMGVIWVGATVIEYL